ncbi:hypothetical protein MYMA111404_02190 [Mycoplasma marinum]|uniref:Uncharacterized protein n=1 Tax=Mycoplasma marinum TaxID=1937190 RepID=A0A4R0XL11_9MOLU|nr:hypothetical protein [Mycoplasma marinum]TCG11346.1 hypothetical protein C4B24_02225 [Mycoplasma marinum]
MIFKRKKKVKASFKQKTTEIVLAELDNVIKTGEVPIDFEPEVSINTSDLDGIFSIELNSLKNGEPESFKKTFKRPNLEEKIIEWLEEIGYERFQKRILSSIIEK